MNTRGGSETLGARVFEGTSGSGVECFFAAVADVFVDLVVRAMVYEVATRYWTVQPGYRKNSTARSCWCICQNILIHDASVAQSRVGASSLATVSTYSETVHSHAITSERKMS